jgi:hypothetical protein
VSLTFILCFNHTKANNVNNNSLSSFLRSLFFYFSFYPFLNNPRVLGISNYPVILLYFVSVFERNGHLLGLSNKFTALMLVLIQTRKTNQANMAANIEA